MLSPSTTDACPPACAAAGRFIEANVWQALPLLLSAQLTHAMRDSAMYVQTAIGV